MYRDLLEVNVRNLNLVKGERKDKIAGGKDDRNSTSVIVRLADKAHSRICKSSSQLLQRLESPALQHLQATLRASLIRTRAVKSLAMEGDLIATRTQSHLIILRLVLVLSFAYISHSPHTFAQADSEARALPLFQAAQRSRMLGPASRL